MYSLYRAWLSLTPGAAVLPPLGDSPNFDYGPPQSSGIPDVTLQVGPTMTHFSAHKNILSAHSGFFKAVILNNAGTNPILVPNVNVDEFSSLLTFMYTGFLDLNFGNIYNILLATHILHMPRALEICRSFLIQHHPLEPRVNVINVVKPIASRKSVLPHQQILPPLFGNLQKSDATPFRAIAPQEKAESTTSKVETPAEKEKPKPEGHGDKKTSSENGRSKKESSAVSGVVGEKVIVDIACCDGPVRFHRVLNENYGVKDLENCPIEPMVDRTALLNKIIGNNIREKQSEVENQQNLQNSGEGSGQDLFTCVYCNHTFKSQYCYQKHARRHLNPVCMEVKSIQKVEKYVSSKREVKQLDMNVQYYPCKTCGSKFPSYYFVHKHRKMCHAEEMGDESVKSMEIDDKSNVESNSAFSDSKNNDESEIEVGNEN